MKLVDLRGKKIRLFFHTDLDGVISASIIQLFSGAQIMQFVPSPSQSVKPPKIRPDIFDVFVDCRAQNRDEDFRIDHHASGETKEYLEKEGIIVETGFKSAVSLVAKCLHLNNIDEQILEELDRVDSGQKNVFLGFSENNETFHNVLFKPGFSKEDYYNYENFKDKLLSYMEKGFAIETLKDTAESHERDLERQFGVIIKDIKKPNKPLIKFVHSPTSEGFFSEKIFTMSGSEFDSKILSYVQEHYYEECKKNPNLGIYIVVAFKATNKSFNSECIRVVKDDHPEPYQIFLAKSQTGTTSINIGTLIKDVKERTGITNGGGREGVGGINTSDKKKALKALNYIIEFIEKNCP